ncbi:MAG: TIGR03790 family protein [Gammaproteobacteria bacterium]
MTRRHATCLFALLLSAITAAASATPPPQILLPKHRLEARELAIIVNDRDPLSREIAQYYRQRRAIPEANLIHIAFEPGRSQLGVEEFTALKNQVDAATPAHIQAYVLTWAAPYRVGCMSITSAFAFGFDRRWCSAERCAPTQGSAYFDRAVSAPFAQLRMRPTMALAAADFPQAKALIDRGVESDASRPAGTAYLVSTTDKARNVRASAYPRIARTFAPLIRTEVVRLNALLERDDVLFYFTGRVHVEGLDSLRFLPGAVADHLTSAGGQLTDSKQMSALRWLEAGATGSYGTVVEPCNLLGKFPNPGVLMRHYLQGATLIEAYWRSVQMPGEGIFIGEPLAAPFDFKELELRSGQITLHTWSLQPGLYQLQTAPSPIGPFTAQAPLVRIGFPPQPLRLPDHGAAVYRLVPARGAR